MRNSYLIPVILLLIFAGCKKSDLPGDNGCISQIKRQNFGIKAADSVAAVALLKQNNLSYTDLQFVNIILNDTISNDAVGTHIYQYISGIQYVKGLPVISDQFGYTFKDRVYQETSGTRYASINLDQRATLSLIQLRKLYLAEIGKRGCIQGNFKDSCLVAQFGYYNLNAGTGNNTPNIVKAWGVTPKNSYYPIGIFRDGNGQTITFFTGIVVF